LFYGARKSQRPQRSLEKQHQFVNHFVSLPFDDEAAEVYGQIRAELERAGTPIGPNDLMIAAIAIANDVMLVTHNAREFRRVKGLRLEIGNWIFLEGAGIGPKPLTRFEFPQRSRLERFALSAQRGRG
jgi:tRNA(fMet)-specific endonuclease VapC